MKKCLVTGASGFVGSHLCRHLISKEWDVTAFVLPNETPSLITPLLPKLHIEPIPQEISSLCSFFEANKFDLVFHLASVFLSDHKPEQIRPLFEANLLFGCHLLEAMSSGGCHSLVNTGTSWQHYENADYNPAKLYAATKQAFEDLARYYVEAKELKMVTLKLFDTYGPNDPRPKLFATLAKIAQTGEQLKMSPGLQWVDFVHVDIVCGAFLRAAQRLLDGKVETTETYGVSSGKPKPLRQVVAEYAQENGVTLNIEWGGRPYRNREVMQLWTRFKTLD